MAPSCGHGRSRFPGSDGVYGSSYSSWTGSSRIHLLYCWWVIIWFFCARFHQFIIYFFIPLAFLSIFFYVWKNLCWSGLKSEDLINRFIYLLIQQLFVHWFQKKLFVFSSKLFISNFNSSDFFDFDNAFYIASSRVFQISGPLL